MAEKTKAELKTQSDTTFYDNNNGEIEPVGHRAFNNNLIDSMATHAQGTKADTAIQAATVGGVPVTKNGTTLVFPQFSTGDGGASTAVQAATVGGASIPKSGTTLVFPAYATAAQGSKGDTAVQAATVGGASVTKTGTTLVFPAFPNISAPTLCNFAESMQSNEMYFMRFNCLLLFVGHYYLNTQYSALTITNIPSSILNKVIPNTSYRVTGTKIGAAIYVVVEGTKLILRGRGMNFDNTEMAITSGTAILLSE